MPTDMALSTHIYESGATPHTTVLACQPPETVTLHTFSPHEHNTGDGLSHEVMPTDRALSTHAYGSGAKSVNTTPSTAPLQSCLSIRHVPEGSS